MPVLTQIDLMSDDTVELPILGVTPKNSLLIQKVTGLNPPDRSLFIGDYSQDGGLYQGRRVGSRNVVFTIDLNPNPALGETVSSLRESLYKAFIDPQVDGDYLKLLLHNDDNREIYLVGYCEKFESEIFSSDTMCQISMICPDPYLRSNQDTIHEISSGWVTFPYVYEGTAETGFIVHIYVTTASNAITLQNNGKLMKLNGPSNYGIGDIIVLDTIRGQRSISITKSYQMLGAPTEFSPPAGYNIGDTVFYGSGIWEAVVDLAGGTTRDMAPGENNKYWEYISTSIASHLSSDSQWLELHSSSNTMSIYKGNNPTNYVANIKYLKYTSAYWGI
jgi:hypothetical protein